MAYQKAFSYVVKKDGKTQDQGTVLFEAPDEEATARMAAFFIGALTVLLEATVTWEATQVPSEIWQWWKEYQCVWLSEGGVVSAHSKMESELSLLSTVITIIEEKKFQGIGIYKLEEGDDDAPTAEEPQE